MCDCTVELKGIGLSHYSIYEKLADSASAMQKHRAQKSGMTKNVIPRVPVSMSDA